MNFPLSRKKQDLLPGRAFVVRSHRDLAQLIARVQPGDLAVIDQLDLDAVNARALAARRPGAVLNAADYLSGRYASLGPQVLADARVPLLRGPRDQVLALRDEQEVRLDGNTLYDGAVVLLDVAELAPDEIRDRMERARAGLAVQLESFAHSASELVHREEAMLLHGTGLPELSTSLAGRVTVVVGAGAQGEDLKSVRRLLRRFPGPFPGRTKPVLIGVDAGLDLAAERGMSADIAVLSGAAVVSDESLRGCREVVLSHPGRALAAQIENLNLPAHLVATSVAPVDLALLLARSGGARLAIPVGAPATLEEFIDSDRNDQASSVLTRLRLGSAVVDGNAAAAVLATRRRRFGAPLAVLVALAVVAGVLAFTPAGHRWRHDLTRQLPESWGNHDAVDRERARVRARDAQIASLQRRTKADESYIDATAAGLVRGTLTGRSVALVRVPGVEAGQVAALKALLTAAGARITAEVAVLPAAADDAQSGLVAALTSQILAQAPTYAHLPAGADGPERFGALLARALGLPASARLQQAAYDSGAVGIVSGLQTAGLVSAAVTARAGLTLFLSGGQSDSTGMLAAIARAYAGQVPTVVAGDAGGVLAVVRSSASKVASTVDGTGTTAGRVAVVRALAARADGTVGSYGRAGADGMIPRSG